MQVKPRQPVGGRIGGRARQLHDQQSPAGPQDPQVFPKGTLEIRDVAQCIAHGHEVGTAVGHGQAFGDTLHEGDGQRFTRLGKHPHAQIHPGDAAVVADDIGGGTGHQSGADGHVQHPIAGFQAGAAQRFAPVAHA